MNADAMAVARRVGADLGLPFEGRIRPDGAMALSPKGHASAHTFSLVVQQHWRSIDVRFEQGAFSGDLVRDMGTADEVGRVAFVSVLESCIDDEAAIAVSVNGISCDFRGAIWDAPWKTLEISIRRGQLPLGKEGGKDDAGILITWVARLAAAVLALLPLDSSAEPADAGALGLPEGAKSTVEVNRYERDRRNRAAALAIHGFACKACGVLLADVYGESAAEYIEVHHSVPVSTLGAGYLLNPKTDLVPLCPNCHGVAHRRSPPYSVSELQEMIASARAGRL